MGKARMLLAVVVASAAGCSGWTRVVVETKVEARVAGYVPVCVCNKVDVQRKEGP
jgi:hypothetical protein